MEIIALISLICLLLFTIVKAADLIEDAFVLLAKKLMISEFFIGFAILGIITSLPEIAITVSSEDTIPELAIGNLLGASLVLLTLVIGISAIRYRNIEFKKSFKEFDLLLALLVLFSSVVAVIDGRLTVLDGVILTFCYSIFLLYLGLKYQKQTVKNNDSTVQSSQMLTLLLKASLGVLLLIVASSLLVDAVETLLKQPSINISGTLVGLIFFAIGTNTPEITLLLTAQRKGLGAEHLAVGNFIGSACVNSGILGILGIMTQGVEITNLHEIVPVLIVLTTTIFMFGIFSWTGRKLSPWEGYALVSLYFVFLGLEGMFSILGH